MRDISTAFGIVRNRVAMTDTYRSPEPLEDRDSLMVEPVRCAVLGAWLLLERRMYRVNDDFGPRLQGLRQGVESVHAANDDVW